MSRTRKTIGLADVISTVGVMGAAYGVGTLLSGQDWKVAFFIWGYTALVCAWILAKASLKEMAAGKLCDEHDGHIEPLVEHDETD